VIDFSLSHDFSFDSRLSISSFIFHSFVSFRMLPVSVEQSKAQRIQRQQARFRDRGGSGSPSPLHLQWNSPGEFYSAFVPSEKNPLMDILLSRTISGESPSKMSTRSRSHSVSPSKARRDTKASQSHESPFRSRRSNVNTEAQAELLKETTMEGECYHP